MVPKIIALVCVDIHSHIPTQISIGTSYCLHETFFVPGANERPKDCFGHVRIYYNYNYNYYYICPVSKFLHYWLYATNEFGQ